MTLIVTEDVEVSYSYCIRASFTVQLSHVLHIARGDNDIHHTSSQDLVIASWGEKVPNSGFAKPDDWFI